MSARLSARTSTRATAQSVGADDDLYIVMAYLVVAYVVMAYVVMAYVVMAYVVVAYVVMAWRI